MISFKIPSLTLKHADWIRRKRGNIGSHSEVIAHSCLHWTRFQLHDLWERTFSGTDELFIIYNIRVIVCLWRLNNQQPSWLTHLLTPTQCNNNVNKQWFIHSCFMHEVYPTNRFHQKVYSWHKSTYIRGFPF